MPVAGPAHDRFAAMFGSIVNLNPKDHYIHVGFILISLANLLVIVAMVVLFALALTVPFIHARRHRSRQAGSHDEETAGSPSAPMASAGSAVASDEGPAAGSGKAPGRRAAGSGADKSGLWTARTRTFWLRNLPPDKMLPDSQPAYVASWVYVFGVLTMVALAVVIASGCVLALEGPIWWHTSAVGLFVNSLHLWSVECFMGFMAIHLWGKFWMASWRGNRQLTWMTGAVAFFVAIFEGFTGYLSQTNFDSQWIAFESKDAMNSAGIGAFFNAMNFGQALMLHIVVIPLVLVVIVVIHIVMVRLRGVAPPIDALPEHLGIPESTSLAYEGVPGEGSPAALSGDEVTAGAPFESASTVGGPK